MSRFFVPIVFVAMISGLAVGLIGGVVARSPETHANVRPQGYDRTPIGYVGEEIPFEGMGLADPGLVTTSDLVTRGQLLFVNYGCAACHGLASQGGVVGPDLDPGELSPSEFRRDVRSGPKGMPAFVERILDDDDLDSIFAFLRAIRQGVSTTSGGIHIGPLATSAP
ncbi:MAG: cytochrome c [Candidatus Limnocylindrales bacterium]